ncbi:hypothetical protein B0H67DRAFT_669774 [Lasiosphaeris hirsuta]|uniref:Protein kinase domain-containing protein n=1 Tax=Lasiosphaeris hirsuta TaxID=260670 RepID=A0AA40AA17_9PEZI|nr:hypothetical protein B0H67DRAFT_669774 [Lasiosphaeris hirsuta]
MAATNKSTTEAFREHVQQFIREHHCFGYISIDGPNSESKAEFVPLVALHRFWTVEKIKDVLWSVRPRIRTDPQHLLDKYLVVFSVLVWMSAPEKIDTIKELNVDDDNLPIDERLINGTDQSDTKEFLNDFSKHQWRFCPLTLDCRPFKKQLNPYHILPITSQELLDSTADEEEDDVVVYKAQWHRFCLGSLPEYRITSPTSDAYKMLSNEVDIYSNLADEDFTHIVKYYGSVVQQGKLTLILEYASGGNLVTYFQEPHPHTTAERDSFWQSFSCLLLGLDKIHHLSQARDLVLKGAHQDIRPQNILVFPPSAETQHCVRFKLADFGTGHVRKCHVRGLDALAAQRVGNGMYSSPESYRDDKVTKAQSPACDVWSLGAVASEALVWSIQGEAGRRKYQDNRCKVTGETNLEGGFHEGSFHNGKCRLPIVEVQHQAVLQFVDENDTVSREASEIILGRMLIANPLDSFPALEIFNEWTSSKADDDRGTNSRHYGAHEGPHSSVSKAPAKRNTKLSVQTRKRDSMSSTYSHRISWPQHHDEDALSEEPSSISPSFTAHTDTATQRRSPYPGHGSSPGSRAGQAQRRNGSPGPSARRVSRVGSVGHHRIEHVDLSPTANGSGSYAPLEPEEDQLPAHSTPTSTRYTHPRGNILRDSSPSQPVSDNFQLRHASGLNIHGHSEAALLPGRKSAPVISQTPISAVIRPGMEHNQFLKSPAVVTSTTLESPVITINEVYTRCIKPKNKMFSKSPDPFKLFPLLQASLAQLKGYGNGRDQVSGPASKGGGCTPGSVLTNSLPSPNQFFIVDDSQSMVKHRDQLSKTVRVLMYLLKKGEVDPDKMELYYTCSRDKLARKNSSDFEKHIDEHTFSNTMCHIFERFDEIVEEVLKTNNRASIYILTDGRWDAAPKDPDHLCRVDLVIRRILEAIKNKHKPSNQVGVQFIRFYGPRDEEDECGRVRLQYLDDSLPEHFRKQGLEFSKVDIADTTDWDGDVGKMLLGGVLSEAD